MLDELIKQLKLDEGFRSKPYRDTVGKLTIGYGRNLHDVGISQGEGETMLWNDANITVKTLQISLPWVTSLSEARFGCLANMAFELGIDGLLEFRKFLGLVQAGNYLEASKEMLRSKWAEQVPSRAQRLSVQMRDSQWYYAS